jgi:hypothetical protein
MKLGVSYLVEHKLDQDERILNLLAVLSGTEVDDVRKQLAQLSSEDLSPPKGKKSMEVQASGKVND